MWHANVWMLVAIQLHVFVWQVKNRCKNFTYELNSVILYVLYVYIFSFAGLTGSYHGDPRELAGDSRRWFVHQSVEPGFLYWGKLCLCKRTILYW